MNDGTDVNRIYAQIFLINTLLVFAYNETHSLQFIKCISTTDKSQAGCGFYVLDVMLQLLQTICVYHFYYLSFMCVMKNYHIIKHNYLVKTVKSLNWT